MKNLLFKKKYFRPFSCELENIHAIDSKNQIIVGVVRKGFDAQPLDGTFKNRYVFFINRKFAVQKKMEKTKKRF